MTQQYVVDTKLSKRDIDLYGKLWVCLCEDAKVKAMIGTQTDGTFSADDFRAFGLSKFLSDPAHETGALFLRWKANRLVEEAGFTHSKFASNHGRLIRKYRMKGWQA